MSKPKHKRNKKIYDAWRKGATIYSVAKLHKLTWQRTKRIIEEHKARLAKLKQERHASKS